jgi:hypothetical protein
MYIFCVIFLVVLLFILHIVLVGFQEILYHIHSMIFRAMAGYKGDNQSSTLVNKVKQIAKQIGIWVMKDFVFSARLFLWISRVLKHHTL